MKRKRHNPEQIIRKLRSAGNFQERCPSLAAFQAAWINGSG